jgi:hypothetical protein
LEKEKVKFEDRPITYLIKINDGEKNKIGTLVVNLILEQANHP